MTKTPIKEHARGRLFKVDFIDEQKTTIEACFYTEETDHFYPLIEEGSEYTIRGAEIAAANKRMTSIPHDYRLIFKLTTELVKVYETPKGEKQ